MMRISCMMAMMSAPKAREPEWNLSREDSVFTIIYMYMCMNVYTCTLIHIHFKYRFSNSEDISCTVDISVFL